MKNVFVFAALMMAGISGYSQGFQIGAKGGLNISNFMGGDFHAVEKKAIAGFHAGAFMNFLIGKGFSIQPEVLFSSQGADLKSFGNKYKFHVSYINVPVLAKYRFYKGFYVELGPQVGFRVHQKVDHTTIHEFAKSTDLSIDGGVGYHSRCGLGVGFRWCVGVTNVGDFDHSAFISPDFKNSVMQFSLFYTLFNNHR